VTEDVFRNVVSLLVTVLVGFNTTILWSMRDLVKKHDQTLYGANNDNGMMNDLKLVRERTHEHARMLTEHAMTLGVRNHQREDDS
jgi:hypothetical protein